MVADCIVEGKSLQEGGAHYNFTGPQGVGVANVGDSLAAIKKLVFEEQALTLADLKELLETDFEGKEDLRQMLLNRTPRYGNDDDYADDIMRRVFEAYFQAVDGRPNTRGGRYRSNAPRRRRSRR